MGRGGEAVIHCFESEVIVTVVVYPLADLRCTPAGLQQEIASDDCHKQGDNNDKEQLSKKFHDLPSPVASLAVMHDLCAMLKGGMMKGRYGGNGFHPVAAGFISFSLAEKSDSVQSR
jgi:hypothetical protein